jgi:two-component sensor histidine kinase
MSLSSAFLGGNSEWATFKVASKALRSARTTPIELDTRALVSRLKANGAGQMSERAGSDVAVTIEARAAFELEVSGRFGVMPSFFYSASAAPGLIEQLWAFTKSAYLDSPLPSLFKERLFVHLSRFCESRYCIVRHVGFLIGEGWPAGDPAVRPQTIDQVSTLLQRPLPDAKALAEVFARLESHEKPRNIPTPETQAEYDLFDALTVMFLEPFRWGRAREAVQRAVGESMFEVLTAFLAFARTAQFWAETHPEVTIEPDMLGVLEKHDGLARLLLDPSEAKRANAGEALRQTLSELEDVRASLRVSSETLELALHSASEFAWEVECDTRTIKITGDPRSALGFDLAPTEQERIGHIHPEDWPCVTAAFEAMLAGKALHDVENRLINPITGETVWVNWAGRLVAGGSRVKLVGITRNITAAKNAELALHESEKRLRVLVAELQHRTRNLISVVGATAEKLLRTSKTFDDFKAGFHDRLGALGRVQGLLFRMKENDRIAFDELIETELSAQSIRAGEAVTIDGPKGVRLRSRTVQTLAMVVHELMTNAVKHGALKRPNAHLAVRWRLETMGEGGKPWLHLDWKESGVEMPPLPHGIGQGRELIERALPYQFDARTMFVLEADGVRCTISLPVSENEG